MQVVIGVLISFAAALGFFVVEPMLLGLDESWRLIAAAIFFVTLIGITHFLKRAQTRSPKEPQSIGAGNTAKQDLDIELKNVKAKHGSGNIASDNKSGGNMNIKISDSEV